MVRVTMNPTRCQFYSVSFHPVGSYLERLYVLSSFPHTLAPTFHLSVRLQLWKHLACLWKRSWILLINVWCKSNLNCRAVLQRMTRHVVLPFFTMASVSLIFGVLMHIVARLAIWFSAWHKARRLDASAHQAEKSHTMYAFMDVCVDIFARLNEEASISASENCDVQLTCVYIRICFVVVWCISLWWVLCTSLWWVGWGGVKCGVV